MGEFTTLSYKMACNIMIYKKQGAAKPAGAPCCVLPSVFLDQAVAAVVAPVYHGENAPVFEVAKREKLVV